ncbi:hypothetical protein [Flavobacterium sp. PS2]|uniref:hypothetical protein n=1 Tax=Flavobacterium sp. PS2 TaxID=3384157 RepID=UPI00390C9871
MKRIILSILLFNFINCNSQITKELENFIKPFEDYKTFNAMGWKNDSISKLLNKKATEEELVYLSLNGKNTFIKGISIETLINSKSKKVFDVYDNLIDSKDTLVYSTECLSSNESFPNFMFQSLTFNRNYSKDEITSNKEILVHKILNKNPINVKLLESINYWIPQNEEFYEPIRKIVSENKSSALLVTIAKYKKENDIELIKSFGIDALPAIEEFPNKQFREILENNIKFDDFQYMFALAKSCTPETVKTVEKAVQLKIEDLKNNDCGNYCLSTIYNQIEMNKCELFYPTLEKLWLTNKIISYNILDNYKKKHSKIETKNFLFNGLMLKGKAEIIHKNIYDDSDFVENMESGLTWNKEGKLIHILNELKKISNAEYLKALENNIIESEDLGLPNFVEELNDNKSLLIVKNSFIDKLKINKNAYGLLSIMEAIKLLNDKETFNKGFEVIKTRKEEFKKFPGWEKDLKDFVNENNLTLE